MGAVLSVDTVLADIEPQLPKVSDIVIDVVSQKTFTELRIPGSTTSLKEEISAAVAEAFPEGDEFGHSLAVFAIWAVGAFIVGHVFFVLSQRRFADEV